VTLAALGHFLEPRERLALVRLEVIVADVNRLVGHRIPFDADVDVEAEPRGPGEMAGVKSNPGVDQRRLFREHLAIAKVQLRPCQFQCCRAVDPSIIVLENRQ